MLQEKPYSLTKEFLHSLSGVKKEDYRKIDAKLEKLSEETLEDLCKMQIKEKTSKNRLATL